MQSDDQVKRLRAPFTEEVARSLQSGDRILLSGVIYTLRDAGHKRLIELLESGGESPFPSKTPCFTTLAQRLRPRVALSALPARRRLHVWIPIRLH